MKGRRITLEISPAASAVLDQLVAGGLHGRDRTKVAERLFERGLLDALNLFRQAGETWAARGRVESPDRAKKARPTRRAHKRQPAPRRS